MTLRHLAVAAAACFALAGLSLAIAHEPVYDAWAWLVWGREVAGLGLDTSSGPSWKPLPVALTAVLSVGGDAAPALWLVLVRACSLFALVLAAVIAYRLTPELHRGLRRVAAGFAALSLLLLADDFTMWTRQGAAGMSEPLLVALVLATVVSALERRPRAALACAFGAALVRPEVWPLLGLYGVWLWRAEPRMRAAIAAVAVAVPALWVVPDLLASGGVASAGERAQRGGGAPLHELLEVFARAAVMPLLVVWPLAVAALFLPLAVPSAGGSGAEREQRSRLPSATAELVLAAGALAWIAVVALMAAAGFPGLPRFMAPAIAVVGVLAGAGLARALALAPRPPAVAAVAIAVLALTVAQLPGRAEEIPHAMNSTARIARSHDRLRELVRSVGREPLLRCGRLATGDVLVRTALAWELRVPLGDVVSFGAPPTKSGAFIVGPESTPAASARLRARGELLGSNGEWRAYSLDCSPTAAASSSRSNGVSGAQR